jgi:Leucine-rich repeat (LRR) protein
MKKIFTLLSTLLTTCLIGISLTAHAQYVTIPDSSFRAHLKTTYPACFNVNDEMDTTCTGIVKAISLSVSSKGIANLEGVQYFDTLQTLSCTNNQLTTLPILPKTLKILQCSQNQLVSLPILPSSLQELFCHRNQLTTLSTPLPNLTKLACGDNPLGSSLSSVVLPPTLQALDIRRIYTSYLITSLPALPPNLTGLYTQSLTSFPPLPTTIRYMSVSCFDPMLLNPLPDSLKDFYISMGTNGTFVPTMPPLPTGLKYLTIASSTIQSLPALPPNLKVLGLDTYRLVALPPLPASLDSLALYASSTTVPVLPPNLQSLICGCGLNWDHLPDLPNSLLGLSIKVIGNFSGGFGLTSVSTTAPCFGTDPQLPNLRSIPKLPYKLKQLVLGNNPNLKCIGILPNSLTTFAAGTTGLTCLPNIPSGIATQTILPVCNQTNNTNGCFIPPIVSGRVQYDSNNNGTTDATDIGVADVLVTDNANSQRCFIAATDSLGYYIAAADTCHNGFKNLTIIEAEQQSSSFISVPWLRSFSTGDTSYQKVPNQNFLYRGIVADDSIQVHIHTSTLVPADSSNSWIFYRNRGTTTLTGTVDFYKSPKLQYGSSNATATQVSANHYAYAYNNLQPFQTQVIRAKLFTPPNPTLIGDTIRNYLEGRGNGGGGGTVDNDTEVKTIRGSHDPNQKQAQIDTLSLVDVQQQKTIEYTLDFENTGTWFAKWITVEDTLSADLDYHSLRVLASSHACEMKVEFDSTRADRRTVVKFVFANINLLWKDSSDTRCMGFVRFAVKPMSNLNGGTVIRNTARIYFDVNPPIVTNDCDISVLTPVATQNVDKNKGFAIFPNPANDFALLSFEQILSDAIIKVFDVNGKEFYTTSLNDAVSFYRLATAALPVGLYFVQVVSKDKALVERLNVMR